MAASDIVHHAPTGALIEAAKRWRGFAACIWRQPRIGHIPPSNWVGRAATAPGMKAERATSMVNVFLVRSGMARDNHDGK